jgi:hypothetical protein
LIADVVDQKPKSSTLLLYGNSTIAHVAIENTTQNANVINIKIDGALSLSFFFPTSNSTICVFAVGVAFFVFGIFTLSI